MTPKISVIIPLYNKEKIVERSVNSVLSQSFKNFELIIVDDGSTDNSFEIVNNIKDDRIRLMRQENGGPSKARNTGAKRACGEWIVFLDADDELLPSALEVFILSIKKHEDANFICCEYQESDGNFIRIPFHYRDIKVYNCNKDWCLGKIMPRTGAAIYKKKLVLKYPFDERIRRFEDFECLFRMFNDAVIYLSSHMVLKVNMNFSSASNARKDISEDFVGHLDFKGKSFWEKMCLYKLYLGERIYYKEQIRKLYPSLHFRYDLLIMYKIIRKFYK
ncbi:glycosyltransferase family 2 protein [Prevotella koreensis]|uniref:glycosyltransferase family 2 protein n=1 Tax=Prevotella koreensis TaxID=2490854 RepID=UPI003F9FEF0C